MLIAFILVCIYAYVLTGYCFQKAEYCEALDEKLIFGVLWPIWFLVHTFRIISTWVAIANYKAKKAWRKDKDRADQNVV
jgi:hypothetical protein